MVKASVMGRLTHPFFIFSIIVYSFIYVGRRTEVYIPTLLNSYVTDILCMPIVLNLSLFLVRKIKKIPFYELSWIQVMGMTIGYALIFEYFLPANSSKYTQDIWDVFCYFFGAVLYVLILQKETKFL